MITDTGICCEALEQITEEYDFPFYRPLMINKKTMNMSVASWSIKLLKKTAAGNVSKKGGATLIMSYCPACGTKLTDIADD